MKRHQNKSFMGQSAGFKSKKMKDREEGRDPELVAIRKAEQRKREQEELELQKQEAWEVITASIEEFFSRYEDYIPDEHIQSAYGQVAMRALVYYGAEFHNAVADYFVDVMRMHAQLAGQRIAERKEAERLAAEEYKREHTAVFGL